jgi:hypothetical protein
LQVLKEADAGMMLTRSSSHRGLRRCLIANLACTPQEAYRSDAPCEVSASSSWPRLSREVFFGPAEPTVSTRPRRLPVVICPPAQRSPKLELIATGRWRMKDRATVLTEAAVAVARSRMAAVQSRSNCHAVQAKSDNRGRLKKRTFVGAQLRRDSTSHARLPSHTAVK